MIKRRRIRCISQHRTNLTRCHLNFVQSSGSFFSTGSRLIPLQLRISSFVSSCNLQNLNKTRCILFCSKCPLVVKARWVLKARVVCVKYWACRFLIAYFCNLVQPCCEEYVKYWVSFYISDFILLYPTPTTSSVLSNSKRSFLYWTALKRGISGMFVWQRASTPKCNAFHIPVVLTRI